MSLYCLVVNGNIGAPASLPRDYRNISNFYALPPADLARYNWYPFNPATPPTFTESTQKLVESLTFTGTQVNQSWQVVSLTQQEQIAFATARLTAIGQAITPYINSQVANKSYESHVSARAVASSADPEWAKDGREATAYYDAIWSIFRSLQAGVQAGTMPLPTVEQFISSLPKLWTPPAPPAPPNGNGTANGPLP
jgi:hypothetical protein